MLSQSQFVESFIYICGHCNIGLSQFPTKTSLVPYSNTLRLVCYFGSGERYLAYV